MRALDQHTIEVLDLPGDVLMESAGRAAVDVLLAMRRSGEPVCVVCGGGNNGGDGLVVARQLHQLGVPVRVALLAEAPSLRGDAARNFARAQAVGVVIESARWRPPPGGLVVDAIFGTGLSRPVAGAAATSIRRMNAARSDGSVRVLAIDLPSGLCADTGRALGVAVAADATLTIGLPKLGLVLEPGRSLAGSVSVARIGIVDSTPEVAPRAQLFTRAGAAELLPERPRTGHKGSFGHVLLVAGSEGKTGAAALAADAAGRCGAGLVTVACPGSLNDILEVKCTEAMTAPLPETPKRGLARGAEEALLALAAARHAVGMAPGIGREPETLELVRSAAKRIAQPLVLDADALIAFAPEPALLRSREAPTILTPHPGEAAALLGSEPRDLNDDRPAAARALARETGCVVVLKGAGTAIATPEGDLTLNPTGGPALATGGTGDVLLGLTVGLLAQGLEAREAAALGAYIHGAAADTLATQQGDSGLQARDLPRQFPRTLAALRGEPTCNGSDPRLVVSFPEP
jgi:NAD(P)H-hydrate epimerase